jgi:hypothetical protein
MLLKNKLLRFMTILTIVISGSLVLFDQKAKAISGTVNGTTYNFSIVGSDDWYEDGGWEIYIYSPGSPPVVSSLPSGFFGLASCSPGSANSVCRLQHTDLYAIKISVLYSFGWDNWSINTASGGAVFSPAWHIYTGSTETPTLNFYYNIQNGRQFMVTLHSYQGIYSRVDGRIYNPDNQFAIDNNVHGSLVSLGGYLPEELKGSNGLKGSGNNPEMFYMNKQFGIPEIELTLGTSASSYGVYNPPRLKIGSNDLGYIGRYEILNSDGVIRKSQGDGERRWHYNINDEFSTLPGQGLDCDKGTIYCDASGRITPDSSLYTAVRLNLANRYYFYTDDTESREGVSVDSGSRMIYWDDKATGFISPWYEKYHDYTPPIHGNKDCTKSPDIGYKGGGTGIVHGWKNFGGNADTGVCIEGLSWGNERVIIDWVQIGNNNQDTQDEFSYTPLKELDVGPIYKFTPSIDVGSIEVESGDRYSYSYKVDSVFNGFRTNNLPADHKYEVTKIVLPGGYGAEAVSNVVGATTISQDPSSYLTNLAGAGSTTTLVHKDRNQVTTYDQVGGADESTYGLSIGDVVCYITSVYKWESHWDNITQNNESVTNGQQWIHSQPACLDVIKSPTLHIHGGESWSGHNCTIDGVLTQDEGGFHAKVVPTTVGPNGQLPTSASWSQYGLFAIGEIDHGFGSGGHIFNQTDDYDIAFDAANSMKFASGTKDSFGGKILPTDAKHCLTNFYNYYSRRIGDSNRNDPPYSLYDILSDKGGTIVNSGDRKIIWLNNDTTISSAELPYLQGQDFVITVDGDVIIENDIDVYAGDYTNISTLPQLTVIAKGNIIVQPDVTRLDGIYVTSGTFYTCGATDDIADGATSDKFRLDGECKDNLTINGAVVSDDTRFQRTLGSINIYDPQPAEVVKYPATIWLQEYGYRKGLDNGLRTVLYREVAPRV